MSFKTLRVRSNNLSLSRRGAESITC